MALHFPIFNLRAVPESILRGVGGNFFLTFLSPGHAERHKRLYPQDKSEYQLLPPYLNILVPQDKLGVIMHPPYGQKNRCAPLRIISGTAISSQVSIHWIKLSKFSCLNLSEAWLNLPWF